MSKRFSCNGNTNTKRMKLDDLWGDDLDSESFERIATQCEQQFLQSQLDVSYSAFSANNLGSSTQATTINLVGTNLENELKELKDKYAEKEGEASVLRAQLRDCRNHAHNEQEKKQKEWKDKWDKLHKEMENIKSQLEFKNLEIANLKQQLSKTKHRILDNSLNQTQTQPVSDKVAEVGPEKIDTCTKNKVITPSPILYPLKCLNHESIFEAIEEHFQQHIFSTLARNATPYHSVPYLKNQLPKSETNFLERLNSEVFSKKAPDLQEIYADVALLIGSSREEIDSVSRQPHLERIISVLVQHLTFFYNYLKVIESNMQDEEIREADASYLKNKNLQDTTNCLGVKAAKLLNFVGDLLPYSKYLQNLLLTNIENRNNVEGFVVLTYKIVRIIGRTRKSPLCTEFLCSVVNFLQNVSRCDCESDYFCDLFKQLLLARPNFKVSYHLTSLIAVASKSKKFANYLCSEPVQLKIEKEVIYFNNSSCCFHILAVLLKDLFTNYNDDLPLILCVNVVSFVYNLFNSNADWLHPKQNETCQCLSLLYKLSIKIVQRSLRRHVGDGSDFSELYKLSLKVANLLALHSDDFLIKYVTSYVLFKEMLNILQRPTFDEDDKMVIETLDTTEEVPKLVKNNFSLLSF